MVIVRLDTLFVGIVYTRTANAGLLRGMSVSPTVTISSGTVPIHIAREAVTVAGGLAGVEIVTPAHKVFLHVRCDTGNGVAGLVTMSGGGSTECTGVVQRGASATGSVAWLRVAGGGLYKAILKGAVIAHHGVRVVLDTPVTGNRTRGERPEESGTTNTWLGIAAAGEQLSIGGVTGLSPVRGWGGDHKAKEL